MTATANLITDAVALAEAELDRVLPAAEVAPARLHEAMRYAIFAGGKRVRPALVLGACRAAGGPDEACLPAMAAVELLHTYTLVHDDLPAMDDDDLRRGRPTIHRAYDEATAILVGDALQCLAFTTLARAGAEAVQALGCAAGSQGVIGGQQDDLDAEGGRCSPHERAAMLERIHRRKTAALIRVSCELGAICGAAAAADRQALAAFGEHVGLAFQVIDDILDATADAQALGKTPGKDAAADKLTWVAVHGMDDAQATAARETAAAHQALAGFGERGADLAAVADLLLGRGS